MIFVTLMLPVEVRIFPTYKIAATFMLDTYAGPHHPARSPRRPRPCYSGSSS